MLSWGVIIYGAAMSAVFALVLVVLARERRPLVLAAVAAGSAGGPIAWNAILRATAADQFFVDAPIPVFPISWQDTVSGVFALAALAVVLGLVVPAPTAPRRVTTLAVLGALAALLADIYLY
jgi:hypothetical protein